VPLAQAIQAIERVIDNGRGEAMVADTAVAIRLGDVVAVVIAGLADAEDFLKVLARSSAPYPIVFHIMLELPKRLGQRLALCLIIVIAPEDRGDALVECAGGLGSP
jgi:hypothetical protein